MGQLWVAFFVLFLIVALGTVGYIVLEGYSLLDALYMTIITIATVGYREVQELSPSGKLFTIILIILGVGAGAWAVTRAVEVTLGAPFWSSVQRRRMNDQIARMSGHYVVCGYGRLGSRVGQDLQARGERFVVIDVAVEPADRLLGQQIMHIVGDATEDDVLLQAGVDRARGLVSALDSDANNVLTVLTARELNSRLLIVARANTESSERKLLRAGANRVVTPDSIGGHRLAIALLRPSVHDFLNRIFSFRQDLEMDVGQVTLSPDSPLAGQTIATCDLRRMRSVSILAIEKTDGEFVLNPGAERRIEPSETLILIGPAQAIYELEAMYGYSAV
jgi:voltage-gated potassium channel